MNFEFDLDDHLHEDLRDVEHMFYFFILSHRALCNSNIQNILKTTTDSVTVSMLEKYNKWVELRHEMSQKNKNFTSSANILSSMNFIGKAMIILMYDALVSNSKINTSEEFKFLKYIRNASAHYNKFNIKDEHGNWKLSDNEEIEWRGKLINKESHGRVVVGVFISVFEIFPLAKDISDKLTQQEKV